MKRIKRIIESFLIAILIWIIIVGMCYIVLYNRYTVITAVCILTLTLTALIVDSVRNN